MAFVRIFAFACGAQLAHATPVVNVIVEPPATAEAPADFDVVSGRVAALARKVQAGERHMHERVTDVLESQAAFSKTFGKPGVTSFLAAGDARADASRLASLLGDVAGSVGAAKPEAPLPGPDLAVPEAELAIRRSLVSAGKKFAAAADAAGNAASTAASFLQPVDANRLRSSLHATEPLRTATPMAVNVIMAEDVRGMQRDAVYKGVAEQAAALARDFDVGLAALGSM